MVPVVMFAGPAGSGKDTVASMLVEQGEGAVLTIAQADPFKRFGSLVFEFTEEQLWGPSEMRNAEDKRPDEGPDYFWNNCRQRFEAFSGQWLESVGMGLHRVALSKWFFEEMAYAKEHGLTPRHVLQTLGTEFGRKNSSSVWVDCAQNIALTLLTGGLRYRRTLGLVGRSETEPYPKLVIVTDGRFPNEILATKRTGGVCIRIDGPGARGLDGSAGKHASETEQRLIPESWYDYVVWNDKSKGLGPLQAQVQILGKQLMPMPALVSPYQEAVG